MNQLEVASPLRSAEIPRPDPAWGAQPPFQSGAEVGAIAAMRRRWLLIATIVVGATALTYAGAQMITPRYSAEVRVMIDLREPSRGALPTDQMAMPPSEETVRKNEVAVIRSRNLAEVVVAELRLDQEPEFNETLRPPSTIQTAIRRVKGTLGGFLPRAGAAGGVPARLTEEQRHAAVVDEFLRRLDVLSSDASRVVGIRFQSEDARRATVIANTVAKQYIAQKRAFELETAQAMASTLEEHIERLNQEVQSAELDIVRARNGRSALPGTDARFAAERMATLNRELMVATAERLRAESRLEELQSMAAGSDTTAAEVIGSPLIQRLQAEAALVAARIGQMSATYGDNYPRLIEARNELRELRARIGDEMANITKAQKSALVRAKANEELLQQEGERLKGAMAEADKSDVDLRGLEREAEAKRNLRSELVSRLNDTKAQIKLLDLQGPAARVISDAVEPWRPSHPPKLAMVAVAFLLSAVCGAILSVLLERRDGTIRCTDQIRALTPARVLGGLPVLRGGRILRSGRSADPLKRNSEFSEKLRGIWLQVSHSGPGPARTILITSPMSGEGKSTIAVSLARMLALSGRKTVILDADLRRPKVHQAFGGSLTPGLAELITRELDPMTVLQRDERSGACYIPAGAPEMPPVDILQMPGLRSAMRALSMEFEAVIIDSPPVLAVHDACLLARRVDRTILVVRWQSTPVASLNATLQYLSDQDIIVDGVLLSMVDGKKYSAYGYQDSAAFSRKFKEYYET